MVASTRWSVAPFQVPVAEMGSYIVKIEYGNTFQWTVTFPDCHYFIPALLCRILTVRSPSLIPCIVDVTVKEAPGHPSTPIEHHQECQLTLAIANNEYETRAYH